MCPTAPLAGDPAVTRHQQMQQWLSDITLLMNAISLLLRLWRESGNFSDQVATNGFFQDTAEGRTDPHPSGGHPALLSNPERPQNRFALRFLPTTEQQIGDVSFQLACC